MLSIIKWRWIGMIKTIISRRSRMFWCTNKLRSSIRFQHIQITIFRNFIRWPKIAISICRNLIFCELVVTWLHVVNGLTVWLSSLKTKFTVLFADILPPLRNPRISLSVAILLNDRYSLLGCSYGQKTAGASTKA